MLREISDCTVIFLETNTESRYERILKRGEKQGETSLSFSEFLEEDNLPEEREIDSLKDLADVTINNDGTWEKLREQLDTLLK